MTDKSQVYLSIIMTIAVIAIVVYVFVYMVKEVPVNQIKLCADNNWTNLPDPTGDSSGIDCQFYKQEICKIHNYSLDKLNETESN